MEHIRVGFAFCGSFCTHAKAIEALKKVKAEYSDVIPIVSEAGAEMDTRFGRAQDFLHEIECICDREVISSIGDAEPIGPKKLLDVLVIAPCTGNTLAKLALGITDSAVAMAAKAHLRNGRPLVLAISTNDGLATAARNIGELLCRKNVYFVPFRQDDPLEKPTSLVAEFDLISAAVGQALAGKQIQPLLLGG